LKTAQNLGEFLRWIMVLKSCEIFSYFWVRSFSAWCISGVLEFFAEFLQHEFSKFFRL